MVELNRITEPEREWLLDHLRRVHTLIVRHVQQMSASEWIRNPEATGWSACEVVEHTLLVEREFVGEVRTHLRDPPSETWLYLMAGKEEMLRKYMPNIGRARASAQMSRFEGLPQHEVAEALERSYQCFSELLHDNLCAPLKAILWEHEGIGPLSAYLWLVYVPLHSERHLNQLRRMSYRVGE